MSPAESSPRPAHPGFNVLLSLPKGQEISRELRNFSVWWLSARNGKSGAPDDPITNATELPGARGARVKDQCGRARNRLWN
jgi:hypothetical protein